MQRGADHACGGLQRRQFRAAYGATFAGRRRTRRRRRIRRRRKSARQPCSSCRHPASRRRLKVVAARARPRPSTSSGRRAIPRTNPRSSVRRRSPSRRRPRRGTTPSAVHSLATTSRDSPAGPACASITSTRSTPAASPINCNTSGTTAMTSGAWSNSRLAAADAASRFSRRSTDSSMTDQRRAM